MPWTPCRLLVEPSGRTVTVSIRRSDSSGAVPLVYSSENGNSLLSLPRTITTATTFWLASPGTYWVQLDPTDGPAIIDTRTIERYGAGSISVPPFENDGGEGGGGSSGVLSIEDFGCSADGTDGWSGFTTAVQAAQGTELHIPAGDYALTATGTLDLGENTTLSGVAGKSRVLLSAASFVELFHNTGDNVTIKGVTFVRESDFLGVLVGVRGNAGLLLEDVTVVGNRDLYSESFHGVKLGSDNGTASDITLNRCIFETCSFPLYQDNTSTATTSRITVRNCVFDHNYNDDLEFNSPAGTVEDVWVEDCTFASNQRTTAGAGFAVGFAHVSRGRVKNCTFTDYNNEAIHIEDYSQEILVQGNSFTRCGVLANSFIQIIQGSTRVKILDNEMDARDNTVSISVVNVLAGGSGTTAGGRSIIAPTRVRVAGNTIMCGQYVNGVYFETVPYPELVGNHIFGNGTVSAGVYAGSLKYGAQFYSTTQGKMEGNTIVGFLYGTPPRTDTILAFGIGATVVGNTFEKCYLGVGAVNCGRANIVGNVFETCVRPMVIGEGNGTAESVTVALNKAYGCTEPFEIYGTTKVFSLGTTATVGSGKTLGLSEAARIAIPNGTAIAFSGGGTLTLTVAATMGATTLTGNVSVASIASGETGTATVAHSATSAKNRVIRDLNADDYHGSSGYPYEP